MSGYDLGSALRIVGNGGSYGSFTTNGLSSNTMVWKPSSAQATDLTLTMPSRQHPFQVLTNLGGGVLGWEDYPSPLKLWVASEQVGTNTTGGTFTSGAWQTRALNTIVSSPPGDTDVQLGVAPAGANQLLLQPGVYQISVRAPYFLTDQTVIKVRDITGGTDAIIGGVDSSSTGGDGNSALSNFSSAEDNITVSGSARVYEIQHRCTTTKSTDGFGISTSATSPGAFSYVTVTKLSP